ncbi:MAG: amidohydrolase family protein [Patescibacteria group bacterium]
MAYSVIIKNGLVFDGQGSPGRKTDIGIEGDQIAAVGDLSGEKGDMEIDASGLYVAPGFIDLTNHSDTHWTLFDQPGQASLLTQGITTILGGNCGSSLAPLINSSDIAAIGKWVDISKINVNWQKLSEFFEELTRRPLALNFATLVGHETLRRAAGIDINRPATPEEIGKMSYLLYQALSDGAFGFSTGPSRSRESSADEEEMRQLLIQVKKANGFGAHHLENEGPEVVSAVSRIAGFSRELGVKGHISHFKVLGRKSWPKQETAFEIIERGQRDGLELTIDLFPYTATGSNLYYLLPEWAREGDKDAILERLKDKNRREEIIAKLKIITLHYEKIIIASTLHDTDSAGKSIGTLAEISGRTPEELMIDLLLINDLHVSIFNENISEDNLAAAFKKDYAAVSSDGVGLGAKGPSYDLPHPRSFGAFARVFDIFVKQKKTISWAEAIYKMTGLPAKILGLKNRGLIEKDAFADIVVFDPEAVRDLADYQTPRQFSRGFRFVFVGGLAAVLEGTLTGEPAGRILKKTE